MKPSHISLLAIIVVFCSACRSIGSGSIERVANHHSTSVASAAKELADADVVYLGEEHDNDVGHELQLELTIEMHRKRPEMVVSMEQFEADVQVFLDAYLAGAIDESMFLAHSRPWPNYAEHYRPVVEWAKQNGVPVLAANIPRRHARTVAYNGLGGSDYSLWSPWIVNTDEPAYLSRFMQAMGGSAHETANASMRRWFAAQCIKDDMMAQSIASVFERAHANGDAAPLVVHWCGRFHSDYRLGTVSRVASRLPDLDQRVVSMIPGREGSRPAPDGLAIGDFVMRVPVQD